MRTLLPLAPLLLGACAPTLTDGFGETLTEHGGCGDVIFYAANPEDTVMLRLDHPGAVAEAVAAGVETTTELTVPDPDTQVVVEVGVRISEAMCTDVIENGGPAVHETWTATAGTATIVIRPDGDDGWGSTGDLTLTGVVFENGADERAELPDLTLTGISVGWLAG